MLFAVRARSLWGRILLLSSVGMAKRAESDEQYMLDFCDEVQARFDLFLGDVSPTTGRASRLPVYGSCPEPSLVVEFQAKQHAVSPDLRWPDDRLRHHSRETRRKHDGLKAGLVSARELRLVVIHKCDFATKRDLIVRDHPRDLDAVRRRRGEYSTRARTSNK